MGIKRYFKNKIKDYQFIKNRRKVSVHLLDLDFFKSYQFNFKNELHPAVSIIIPVLNDIQFTLNCLYHLEKNDSSVSKEIIIINDKSTDETLDYLTKIEGISIINNEENIGFVKSINKGINAAKGEYVYLLNPHNLVQKKCLSNLVEIIRTKDNVGAVGSKLISSENTIIEAGNLFLKDSKIIKLGHSNSIETPQFNFLKKVDFCSGSLLFKRINDNGNLVLLNELFSTVYFAEADLCLRLKKEENLETYYHPFSEIIYAKKINDDENIDDKKSLIDLWDPFINEKFINNGKDNYKTPNFLFLEENMPKPDQDSGSRRFMEIVKILQKNGYNITLAIKHFDEAKDLDYIPYFQNAGVQICTDYVNAQNKIVRVNEQVLESLSFVNIIWIFRPIGFDHWYNLLKGKTEGIKVVYDMVDLHYLRMERENNYIDVITKEREKEIKFFREKEYFGMNTSDAVLSISDEEKNTVSENGVKYEKIFTVSNIHKPENLDPVEFSKREGLLFIGGYNHLPNIDAVKFLHDGIMPLVWEKNENIKLFILGPDFPEDLKQKYHSDRFQILGYQKSVDHWFENSRIFVAPLRYGAGVKGKIGQALEFKLPVITTEIGAEGMSLENRKTALISDENPQNFADKILELYADENLWQTLHENCLQPLSKFSIETQEENIKKMLKYLGF